MQKEGGVVLFDITKPMFVYVHYRTIETCFKFGFRSTAAIFVNKVFCWDWFITQNLEGVKSSN